MVQQPYHKYVFDLENRTFVGHFEEMYANEEKENYDSWFQEDLSHLGKQISLLVLKQFNFKNILDIGCGKGAFTHLLKRESNSVAGVDVSSTAIAKAKMKYRDIDFRVMNVREALTAPQQWDLIVMMEILSYLKDWKSIIAAAAKKSSVLYMSLYLPPNPIGFVKSFEELREEIQKYFFIQTEILWNQETVFLLAKSNPNV